MRSRRYHPTIVMQIFDRMLTDGCDPRPSEGLLRRCAVAFREAQEDRPDPTQAEELFKAMYIATPEIFASREAVNDIMQGMKAAGSATLAERVSREARRKGLHL
mmetsp:Transcript_69191/g.162780  ORF Transcript_69191/g.162780 Transcript_69191/m.162780 type:complete len:104 (+) Transcript_69191:437-748(+)